MENIYQKKITMKKWPGIILISAPQKNFGKGNRKSKKYETYKKL